MNIIWHGQTCFKISASSGRNNSANILIDPFSKETGLKPPREKADIFLFTNEYESFFLDSHTNKAEQIKEGFVVKSPGEYEIKDIFIKGIEISSEQVVYVIESEGIKVCHLGFLNKEELSSAEEEEIGDVDILMIPVGGGGALDAKKAAKIVSQIEPKIIIPMHYHIPGLKTKLGKAGDFLEVLGIKPAESQAKLSIKKRDISGTETKTIILTPAV